YQWIKGKPDGLNAGLGYTALVTARARFANYMLPIPAVLPLASISYDKVSLNGTFVPGFQGFGQIFFFWSRVSF
ncbi:MAG TPA: phospholipid:lipid A palmitoyltransferase, partial [Methylophilus sp.]